MGAVKVKLKAGNQEIEVEGSKSEVDELLKAWWERVEKTPPLSASEHVSSAPPRRVKRKKDSTNASDSSTAESGVDEVAVANAIKDDARFPLFEQRVLHKKDAYRKIALVCRQANEPMTSGQVARILAALDVKTSTAQISTSLKNNMGNFMTTGARQLGGVRAKYKLTSRARTEFEAFLNG